MYSWFACLSRWSDSVGIRLIWPLWCCNCTTCLCYWFDRCGVLLYNSTVFVCDWFDHCDALNCTIYCVIDFNFVILQLFVFCEWLIWPLWCSFCKPDLCVDRSNVVISRFICEIHLTVVIAAAARLTLVVQLTGMLLSPTFCFFKLIGVLLLLLQLICWVDTTTMMLVLLLC